MCPLTAVWVGRPQGHAANRRLRLQLRHEGAQHATITAIKVGTNRSRQTNWAGCESNICPLIRAFSTNHSKVKNICMLPPPITYLRKWGEATRWKYLLPSYYLLPAHNNSTVDCSRCTDQRSFISTTITLASATTALSVKVVGFFFHLYLRSLLLSCGVRTIAYK